MYQTLEYLRKYNITNVVDFGKTFVNGNKEYDLLLASGLFIELKNVNFVSSGLNAQKIDQLIQGYFANISSLDDMKWVAAFRKLKAGGWDTEAQALTEMKSLWKTAFESRNTSTNTELFDAIWANQNLRNSLFGSVDEFDQIIIDQKKLQLNSWINDTNSILYNFIIID